MTGKLKRIELEAGGGDLGIGTTTIHLENARIVIEPDDGMGDHAVLVEKDWEINVPGNPSHITPAALFWWWEAERIKKGHTVNVNPHLKKLEIVA